MNNELFRSCCFTYGKIGLEDADRHMKSDAPLALSLLLVGLLCTDGNRAARSRVAHV